MKVTAIKQFRLRGTLILPGTVLKVSEAAAYKLGIYAKRPRSWLTENGDLRTSECIQDLEAEIVILTADNLPLQRRLLTLHCESYDSNHLPDMLRRCVHKMQTLMKQGLNQQDAELEAARSMNMLAFITTSEKNCNNSNVT